MKRFLATILTVTMCLGLLAGCGKSTIKDTWDGTIPEWAQLGEVEYVGTKKLVKGETKVRKLYSTSIEVPTEWEVDFDEKYSFGFSENGMWVYVTDDVSRDEEEICESAIDDRLRERQGSFVFAESFDVEGSNSTEKSYAFGFWNKEHTEKEIRIYIADFNNNSKHRKYYLAIWLSTDNNKISWEDFRKEVDNYIIKIEDND